MSSRQMALRRRRLCQSGMLPLDHCDLLNSSVVNPGARGDRSSKIWSGRVTDIDAPKVSACYMHLCIWYCDKMLTLSFSPKPETCTIKLGQSQILDILRRSGSDLPRLCDGSTLLQISWGKNRPWRGSSPGNTKKSTMIFKVLELWFSPLCSTDRF